MDYRERSEDQQMEAILQSDKKSPIGAAIAVLILVVVLLGAGTIFWPKVQELFVDPAELTPEEQRAYYEKNIDANAYYGTYGVSVGRIVGVDWLEEGVSVGVPPSDLTQAGYEDKTRMAGYYYRISQSDGFGFYVPCEAISVN